MNDKIKGLGITVIIIAVITVIIGAAFLYQGFAKQNIIVKALQDEKISMAPFGGDPKEIISTLEQAQKAGDTVREHRHNIAPTYSDLLGGKKYDPTNPLQLTYAQAMNLENYLYLAVASIGLVQVVLGSGAFMILAGLAFGLTGGALLAIAKK